MDDLFHIATRDGWSAARDAGRYTAPSLGSEGFIHLSAPHQVLATANRFYAGRHDLVVLVIDPRTVAPDLRWEEGEPGELFPHLYAPLELGAVRATCRLVSTDGVWTSLGARTAR
jgi:uncharacterized protein (DUF952 family)